MKVFVILIGFVDQLNIIDVMARAEPFGTGRRILAHCRGESVWRTIMNQVQVKAKAKDHYRQTIKASDQHTRFRRTERIRRQRSRSESP